MMGRTHVIIGITAGTTLIPLVQAGTYTPLQFGLIMGGLVVGSLLPDIDHPHSLISQQIPLVGGIISRLTRHRGLFHSCLGVVILIIGLGFLSAPLAGGLSIVGIQQADKTAEYLLSALVMGYILHIMADIVTVSGVRLFYPQKFTVRIPIFTTGGYGEWILSMGLIVVSGLQILSLFIG